jgi:hypothetical protein
VEGFAASEHVNVLGQFAVPGRRAFDGVESVDDGVAVGGVQSFERRGCSGIGRSEICTLVPQVFAELERPFPSGPARGASLTSYPGISSTTSNSKATLSPPFAALVGGTLKVSSRHGPSTSRAPIHRAPCRALDSESPIGFIAPVTRPTAHSRSVYWPGIARTL